ncbi:hypothetical protein FHG87_005997 [Trinorchestia longiramus]|nr:hypothetical protein FHG87_005997 [Trinorchestia longiramus]
MLGWSLFSERMVKAVLNYKVRIERIKAGSSNDALNWLVHLHGMAQSDPGGISLDDPGSQEKNSGMPSCCMGMCIGGN